MMPAEELSRQLDSLLERYLDLVDKYDQAQREIQRHIARGFFSLAQANTRSSIGRRYGADWYDDRTKATVIVKVGEQRDKTAQVSIAHQPRYAAKRESEKDISPEQLLTAPQTPQQVEDTDKNDSEKDNDAEKLQLDPVFWFGMLPSGQLRTTQASFRAIFAQADEDDSALQRSPIEVAANAARELRRLETDIRKQRKLVRQAERTASNQC